MKKRRNANKPRRSTGAKSRRAPKSKGAGTIFDALGIQIGELFEASVTAKEQAVKAAGPGNGWSAIFAKIDPLKTARAARKATAAEVRRRKEEGRKRQREHEKWEREWKERQRRTKKITLKGPEADKRALKLFQYTRFESGPAQLVLAEGKTTKEKADALKKRIGVSWGVGGPNMENMRGSREGVVFEDEKKYLKMLLTWRMLAEAGERIVQSDKRPDWMWTVEKTRKWMKSQERIRKREEAKRKREVRKKYKPPKYKPPTKAEIARMEKKRAELRKEWAVRKANRRWLMKAAGEARRIMQPVLKRKPGLDEVAAFLNKAFEKRGLKTDRGEAATVEAKWDDQYRKLESIRSNIEWSDKLIPGAELTEADIEAGKHTYNPADSLFDELGVKGFVPPEKKARLDAKIRQEVKRRMAQLRKRLKKKSTRRGKLPRLRNPGDLFSSMGIEIGELFEAPGQTALEDLPRPHQVMKGWKRPPSKKGTYEGHSRSAFEKWKKEDAKIPWKVATGLRAQELALAALASHPWLPAMLAKTPADKRLAKAKDSMKYVGGFSGYDEEGGGNGVDFRWSKPGESGSRGTHKERLLWKDLVDVAMKAFRHKNRPKWMWDAKKYAAETRKHQREYEERIASYRKSDAERAAKRKRLTKVLTRELGRKATMEDVWAYEEEEKKLKWGDGPELPKHRLSDKELHEATVKAIKASSSRRAKKKRARNVGLKRRRAG